MLLAGLSPAAVEVGVDLRHRGGVVDVGGGMVGIVVVAGSSTQDCRSRFGNSHHISEQTLGEASENWSGGRAGRQAREVGHLLLRLQLERRRD